MANTPLERAQRHYQQGELPEALSAYQEALEREPQSIIILHAIGAIKAQLGEEDALDFIEKALKLSPQDISILNSKANILARNGDFDQAIETFNNAIKLDPQYAIALNGLGKCLLQTDRLTLAEKAFQKALTLKPHFIEAQFNYALTLTKQERWQEAIDLLEPLVTDHPNFAAALGQLGDLYLQTGDHQRALKVCDRRAELEPENPEALYSLAQALSLTNHTDEAIQYYEKTLMLEPHHPEANHNLANTLVQQGDTDKALNYYFRQLSVAPLAESYFNIGVLLMYKERNKEAIEYLEHALTLDPTNINIALNLGSIYLKQQNAPKAISSYEMALAQQPDNTEVQYILSALKDDATPERAPDDYLKNLFNHYADHYDEHLTKYLDYTVPQKLAQLLFEAIGSERETWKVVDLGCGTGLSGVAIKPFAHELIGIDLSAGMIEHARQRGIYDTLIVGDIETSLASYRDCDLILAADVFSYLGDLSAVFAAAHNSLKSSGYLLFSVERLTEGDYKLQKNMRYAHSSTYIELILSKYNFEIRNLENTILRKQQKQPVEGYLVLAKKLQKPN